MNHITRLKPLFHPGRLHVTPLALDTLRANGIPIISVVLKHLAGDWGAISDEDRQQNDLSVTAGLRLLSVYVLPDESRIVVATEWDRSSTTIERLAEKATWQGSSTDPSPAHQRISKRVAPHFVADTRFKAQSVSRPHPAAF